MPESIRRRAWLARTAPRTLGWRRRRRLGQLRRTTPIDEHWGVSRGGAIDRIYIEEFVRQHRGDLRGHVLEAQADDYSSRFGVDVQRVDVLHAVEGNPRATIVADLVDAPEIGSDTFDCALLTQVLPFVFDVAGAIRTVHRILRPEGVFLATVPGITKVAPIESELYGDWWRFTAASARRLTGDVFGVENVEVTTYGNVLAATGLLYGLGAWDLSRDELAAHDPAFEVTVGIRAVKRG